MSEQNFAKPSFFDTLNSNSTLYQLWLTEAEFQKKYKASFNEMDKGKLLYQGIMCKQDQDTEINEYYFKLYDKYLVQCMNNNSNNSLSKRQRIIGIMELEFVKLDHQDDINELDDEMPFLLLTRNSQYEILVPNTLDQFNNWFQFLSARCILTNFGKFYETLKIIGKGTFAKVMLCKRKSDGKKFAVKTYDKKKIKNAKNAQLAIKGIQNEVKIMQKIQHNNIIKLHEIYEGEFHIYLVLELLTGGELFTKLHQIDNYSEKNACIFLKNLLEALNYLHSQGIMHRDIKPENLILRNEQSETEIVLADFGLSEYYDIEDNLLFKRCGTPGYVAPEILNHLPYDTKADVFSAGIIFYIVLTGYSPFFGDSYEEILNRNKKCKICFEFEKINLQLSPESIDLLKSMLKENPKERLTASQALNHPWFDKFIQNNDNKNVLKLPLLNAQYQDQSQIIKQTKPNHQKFSNSNELIQNSPVIYGNINEIQSPFNKDSPQVLITTPLADKECKQEFFSSLCKEAMEKMDGHKQKNQNNSNYTSNYTQNKTSKVKY